MMRNYSMELADVVKDFLEEDNWPYSFEEETGIFHFVLQMKSKNINYFVEVREKSLSFYGITQMNANPEDEKLMGQMAEFVCRANHGLKNGCFDLNFKNGEICYRSYLDCDGIIPSKNMVKNSIYCIATMYMAYAPAISDILSGNATAKEAVGKCEEEKGAE